MIGQHTTQFVEPERRNRGERSALLGHRLTEHDVEDAETVRRDEKQVAVTGVVDVADLAAVDVLELSRGMFLHAHRMPDPRVFGEEPDRQSGGGGLARKRSRGTVSRPCRAAASNS